MSLGSTDDKTWHKRLTTSKSLDYFITGNNALTHCGVLRGRLSLPDYVLHKTFFDNAVHRMFIILDFILGFIA